jgi:hypothetical protein
VITIAVVVSSRYSNELTRGTSVDSSVRTVKLSGYHGVDEHGRAWTSMLPEQQIVSMNSKINVDFVYVYSFGTDPGDWSLRL